MRSEKPARHLARAMFTAGVTGAALVTFVTGPALAQSLPPELEEIVVTAQKREQAITDVPISITAIGAQQLEVLRATSVVDYITEIPNATYISFGAFGSAVSLRGINGFSGGIFSPVAILIDDAGFGAANLTGMLNAQFMDLERVEVLRGPQGVLSGRNALGGAINLVTAKPDPEKLQFKGTLDYSRYQTTYVQGVLNAPLADNVAVRVVAYKEDSDGSVKNLGPSGGTSSTDNVGGRVAIRWQPTDALTIDASYAYDDQEYGLGEMLRANIFASPESRQAMMDELAEWGGDFYDTTFFENGGVNGGTVRIDVDERTTYETAIAALSVRYEVADHAIELKYSNYDYENSIIFDWDKTEFSWLRGVWGSETKSDSAELKVSSQYDGPFNWVAGIGYLDEESGYPSSDDIGTWADEEDTLPPLAGAYRLMNVNDYRVFLKSLGFFANVFYDIGERWHLSVGGRYSIEKTQVGSYYIEDTEDPRFYPGAPLRPEDMSAEAEISEFSPRVAINYDLTDNLTTYFQYATGYRAGYGNSAEAALYGLPMDVQPEKVTNYELGLKGQLLDNRLSFALALFHMKYEDLQVTLTIGNPGSNPLDPPVSYDSNAGESVSQGVEFEGAFRVTDGLTLSGGFAYTDAELDEFTVYDVLPDPDVEGAVIVVPTSYRNTPVLGIRPWTATFAASYERQVTAGLRGMARASYQYQDDVYTEGLLESESQVYKVPKYETVDVSVGIGDLDERWTLTAYADNILDEDYFLSTQFEADTSRRGGFVSFLPRTYGLRFTVTF